MLSFYSYGYYINPINNSNNVRFFILYKSISRYFIGLNALFNMVIANEYYLDKWFRIYSIFRERIG